MSYFREVSDDEFRALCAQDDDLRDARESDNDGEECELPEDADYE